MDNAIINGNATNYFSKSLVTTTQDMIKQLVTKKMKLLKMQLNYNLKKRP